MEERERFPALAPHDDVSILAMIFKFILDILSKSWSANLETLSETH